MVKNPPSKAGDSGSVPGSERSPGEGNGNQLQYSYLGHPHGPRSLAGYNPGGRKEPDTTENARTTASLTSGNKMPPGGYSSVPRCVHVTRLTQNRVAQTARLSCRGASE